MTGQQELKPRWKRVLRWGDQFLGEMVGEVYCQRVFPAEVKAKARAIVDDLVAVLRDRIQTLEWLGPETKAKAAAKIANFGVKVRCRACVAAGGVRTPHAGYWLARGAPVVALQRVA